MGKILCIETSSSICSVALGLDGELKYVQERVEPNSHSKYLNVLIQEILSQQEDPDVHPDAICVSLGPGSYTGLRIGASAAKGLALAWDIPIIGVKSTHILARAYMDKHPDYQGSIIPMIDARRMEVYSAVYSHELEVLEQLQPKILDSESYQEFLNSGKVVFIGDGAQKWEAECQSENASFDHEPYLHASNMVNLAEERFQSADFLDTAYFEPTYLKEFMIVPSKKKFF